MRTIKVAAIQLECIPYDKKQNMQIAEDYIRQAAAQGADMIVLPELFQTGYQVEDQDTQLAETIPGETTDALCSLSEELNVCIIGNIIEKSFLSGTLYDTSFVLSGGLRGVYRKIYLWQTEQLRFKRGTEYPVIDLGFVKIGMQICYEAGFPEGARLLALKGAEIIIYCAAFSGERSYVWDLATRARALENGVFVIGTGRAGQEAENVPFAAMTRIVGPKGQILSQVKSSGSELIVQEIELDDIERQRKEVPYMRDYDLSLTARQFSSLLVR